MHLYLFLVLAQRVDRLVDLLEEFRHQAVGLVLGRARLEVLGQALLGDLDARLDLGNAVNVVLKRRAREKVTQRTYELNTCCYSATLNGEAKK